MRRLLIFLKYPMPGLVKTRLAAAVGAEVASEIARTCAELTLEHLRAVRSETTLYVDPPDAMDQVQAWLEWSEVMRPQQGTTLGERLAHATAEAFTEGASRVVVIGTDSPWLGRHEIEQAFEALADAEVVLGPTEDGGYYLLGLGRPLPALFQGIPWSTASVFSETTAKAQALGLRVQTLSLGYDVDRLEDLQRLLATEKGGRGHA